MIVEFPRHWQPKRPGAVPCTTRTIGGSDQGLAHVWEQAEASLQTEISHDVLAEAVAIASAERSRTRMRESLRTSQLPVTLSCLGGCVIAGAVHEIGDDWLLIARESGLVTGVQLSMVLRISGVHHGLASESPASAAWRTWSRWLRALVEHDVGRVQMTTLDGWTAFVRMRFVGSDFARVAYDDGSQADVMLGAMSSLTVERARLTG